MSRVLMTQMGFVAIVEQAPAVRDAYPRDSHQLSVVGVSDYFCIQIDMKRTHLCVRRSIRGTGHTRLDKPPM